MRVSSDLAQLDITPGARADVTLNVVNTGTVIDGISARVVGMPDGNVTTRPSVLPLFPDSAGQMTVSLGLPQSFPAGRHPMTVEVLSRQPDTLPSYVNLDLLVPSAPAVGLGSRPQVIRARRSARYIITVTNRGNVTLDATLKVNDPQKACGMQTRPATMTLPPGASGDSILTVRAPRMIMGAESDRALTVQVLARPAALAAPTGAPEVPAPPGTDPRSPDAAPDPVAPPDRDGAPAADASAEVEPLADSVTVTFRQRPYVTRGVLTALILLAIIALWAAAFLFGLSRVFTGDPMTKTAPMSFFAATPQQDQQASATGSAAGTRAGATRTDGDGTGAAVRGGAAAPGAGSAVGVGSKAGAGHQDSDAVPVGALKKNGVVPGGVGGTISGVVTAASSGDPVGRILVQAYRIKADGSMVPKPTAAAATQADGSYQVAGLFPASYLLKFSAPGFVTSYFPDATSLAKAQALTVAASAINSGGSAVIAGKPATITGTVDPGNTTEKVTTTVRARLLEKGPGAPPKPIPAVTATRGEDGVYTYTIDQLPAPGTYQLTFTTPGYQPTTVRTTVTGGAQRYQSTVVLTAGQARISGDVTDGTDPLGGVTISTTVAGKQITTGTPTKGKVGHFTLGDLPTPATYVITASKAGYGQVSQVIDLAPGKPQNMTITLAAGTGVVDGTLVDAAGAGIGGATVTVGGMADPPSTVTLTDGAVGSFHLTGLPTPGSYTLTFSLAGYADQTVPVTLSAETSLKPIRVVMAGSVGSITGRVTGSGGHGVSGATVTATDGQHSWPVTTTGHATGTAAGSYTVANLPAGSYTVTATGPGGGSQTALVTVAAGPPETVNFQLDGGG